MQIVTNGRNIDLTEPLKEYVQLKVSRLQNHYDFILEVHVILEVEKNPRIADNQLAEATIHVNGAVIRVEAASQNLYASIDKLVDKMERSLQKHKTRLLNRNGKSRHPESIRRDVGVTGIALDDEGEPLDPDELDVTIEPVDEDAISVESKS